MQAVTNDNFGPLIAYLVPGATVLAGLSNFSPTLKGWFAVGPSESPSIGGFLFLTVAAIAVGMTVSAIRWATVDTLHEWTGLAIPSLNFSLLGTNVDAFVLLIEIHYRHYQFYANMLVASVIAYGCYRFSFGGDFSLRWIDFAFVGLEAVFFATSRDTLSKYYARSQQLLTTGSRQHEPPPDTTCASGEPIPVAQQTPATSGPASGKQSEAE
jgi:hypothetical protein